MESIGGHYRIRQNATHLGAEQRSINPKVLRIKLVVLLRRLQLVSIIRVEARAEQSALCNAVFNRKVVIIKLTDAAIGKVTRASEIHDRGTNNRRLAGLD